MVRLPVRALSLLLAGFTLLVSGVAVAEPIELKNDTLTDNSQGKAICGFNVGEGFGVRFTPPAYPAKLLKVRVLMTNVGLSLTTCNHVAVEDQIPLTLEVFKYVTQVPGTSLLQGASVGIGNDSVLNEFDVSTEDVSIDDGAFFVAFTLESDKASPMIDQGATVGDGNYIYGATEPDASSEWFSFKQLGSQAPSGNWVVRVTVDVPGNDAGAQDGGVDGSAGAAGSTSDASFDSGSDGGTQPTPPPESAEGGGCSVSGGRSGVAGTFGLALLGLACAMRRRRSRA
jgi:hypothetical protein